MSVPALTHIYQNHHLDSTRWEYFEPRSDDIVISTSYKAGTTWMQTIVANLLHPHDDMLLPVTEMSPWLDMRMYPLEGVLNQLKLQNDRRFIKTHLPLDGLSYHRDIRYIVVGRDARDVFMSLLNHWGNHTDAFYESMNGVASRVGEVFPRYSGNVRAIWTDWMTKGWFDWETEGYPYWGHMNHCMTWWKYRHLPNIKLVHYSDLLTDLETQMREIAEYLGIQIPNSRWPHVVDACRFETVKKNPEKVAGNKSFAFKGGADTFINKGTNGRWKHILNESDLALYEAAKERVMSKEAAMWLETGWCRKSS